MSESIGFQNPTTNIHHLHHLSEKQVAHRKSRKSTRHPSISSSAPPEPSSSQSSNCAFARSNSVWQTQLGRRVEKEVNLGISWYILVYPPTPAYQGERAQRRLAKNNIHQHRSKVDVQREAPSCKALSIWRCEKWAPKLQNHVFL